MDVIKVRVKRSGRRCRAHRGALRRWLDELDALHGRATPEETDAIEAFVEEVSRSSTSPGVA